MPPPPPSPSRTHQVVDKHNVSIFYTAPTAIRALMREGEGPVKATSRKSLRVLGEPGARARGRAGGRPCLRAQQ